MARFSLLLLLTNFALPAHAETLDAPQLAKDILACDNLGYGSCPALGTAMPIRDAVAKVAAGMLPPASAAEKAKIALLLSLLDARTEVDALEAAGVQLGSDPAAADVRAAQARLGDVRAAPALLALLASGEVRAQLLATGGLGLLRHKPATAPLVALLGKGAPRLQAAAAGALGQIGNVEAEPALFALAAGPRTLSLVRTQALEALAALHSATGVILATMLIDATPTDVARAALHILAAVPTEWTDAAVMAALDTPGARGEAAKALVAMKLTSAGLRVLDTAVLDDLAADERTALHAAVVAFHPTGAAAALVRRFGKLPLATAPDEAFRILRLLPQLADKTVVPDLVPFLRLDSKDLVNHVVRALESLTGEHYGSDEKPWREYAGLDRPPPAPPAAKPPAK